MLAVYSSLQKWKTRVFDPIIGLVVFYSFILRVAEYGALFLIDNVSVLHALGMWALLCSVFARRC